MSRISFLKKCLLVIFHPIDCFDIIKRERSKFQLFPIVILYFLTAIINYIYIFIVHYPLSTKSVISANLFLEIGIVVVPLLTWTVASYAVTSIINGESKLTELLTSYSYCFVPYIIFNFLLGICSNFLGFEQAHVYFFIRLVVFLWTIFLIMMALKYLNDYKLFETIGIAILSILLMLVIWGVILLLSSLTVQLISFFKNIYLEIIYKI